MTRGGEVIKNLMLKIDLIEGANVNAIIVRLEEIEKIPCKDRFVNNSILCDIDDEHDNRILRFLNTVDVIGAYTRVEV